MKCRTGSGQRKVSSTPRWCRTSFSLPKAWIAADPQANRLEIEVRGQPLRKSGLSIVQLGDAEALHARYGQLMWWQVYAAWMVAACSLMVGLMSLLMWLQTRERMFGLLACATFAWTRAPGSHAGGDADR